MIWRANNAVQRAYNVALDPVGLTYFQFIVLRTLAFDCNKRAMRQKLLVRRLGAEKTMVSEVVRSLANKQLVMRARSLTDGRAVALRVRPKGLLVLKDAEAAVTVIEEKLIGLMQQKPDLAVGLEVIASR